jgi:exodeoxyribonuclease VII small subunit
MPRSDNPPVSRSQSEIFTAARDSAIKDAANPPTPGSGGADAGHAADGGSEPLPGSFESALTELEDVVARMESGELTLEQSLSAYKRGAALLQYCQGKLNDAQQQVRILEAGVLKDFSGAGENGQ